MTDEPTPHPTAGTPPQPAAASSVERNKAVSRRWIDVFNQRDDAAEADVRAQGYVAHAPVSLEPNPLDSEAWTRFLAGFVDGFPDLRLTVEDAVGVDGRVVEHWFQPDSLSLLQQLGLVVVPGPRLLPRILAHEVKKLRRIR